METINTNCLFPSEDFLEGKAMKIEKPFKLKKETCEKYNMIVSKHEGETAIVSNYINSFGELTGQKVIKQDETFFIGEDDNKELYGQQLFKEKGKKIIITDSEIDALTIYQILKIKYAVVSFKSNNFIQEIKNNFEYINSYNEILFCLNSENKVKFKEIINHLDKKKCKNVMYPDGYHTANDLIINNKEADLYESILEAKTYKPDTILRLEDKETKKYFMKKRKEKAKGYDLPFSKLNEAIRGLRKGEILTLISGSGQGKTTITKEMVYTLIRTHKLKVGLMSLEEDEVETIEGLIALHLNINRINLENVPDNVISDVYDELFSDGQITVFKHDSDFDLKTCIEQMEYMYYVREVDFIAFDHITIATQGEEGDDRKKIDLGTVALRKFVVKTGVGIILISHVSNPVNSNKGYEDGFAISVNAIRGSGSIKQVSNIIIALETYEDTEKERINVRKLKILKNRYTGIVGYKGEVMYYFESGRMLSWEDDDIEKREKEKDEETSNNFFDNNYKDEPDEDNPFN